MRVSTRGRYALRLMLDLATYSEDGPVSLKDVAKRQGISDKYLEQIIAVLNKAGYVKSVRGAQGGYLLKRNPTDYTVGMILRLTEGDLSPVGCVGEGKEECERKAGCVTIRIWQQINDAVNGVVDNITLADMLVWQEEMAHDPLRKIPDRHEKD
ncbi:MAG: Rrf2 family transcriptional regulator [Bacillus sp. (in: Bacteria)]|nr:Rrf2 family transcriptional regulator [Bacillus sp. (in: firmicutes)]MCM1425277.1 Rrf2 family transcriptional regulator [Eubacterium sp.]